MITITREVVLETYECSFCGLIYKDQEHCEKHELLHLYHKAGHYMSDQSPERIFIKIRNERGEVIELWYKKESEENISRPDYKEV